MIYDDAIHMADLTRVNRTLCDQPLGELNVQAARPDFASGCWTCLTEDDKRPRRDAGAQGQPRCSEAKGEA
jgi:hypothetical protein